MFKRITFLILMLGLTASSLFAQDINEIDELNASARALLQLKGKDGVEEARELLLKSLQKSVQLNYSKGEIEVYNLMAESFELEGNPQIALRYRKKANKKSANPDAPSNVIIVKPNTIEEFATSTIPASAKAKSKATEELQTSPTPDQSRPPEVKKPVYQPTFTPTVVKLTGNTENDIKNKQSELEEYRRRIEELQKQAAQEGDSLSAIRNAEIARLNAERERTQSQIEALEKEKENTNLRIKQQRIIGIILIIAVIIMLFFVLLVIRQIRAKNKANKELAKAIEELKATQAQLVQQEKLASLGQLTAGIAHEIQNPLNFVNNFADLSLELLSELKESDAIEEIKAIADDLTQNLSKIHHHGKRADSIVKNMLQHSREQKGDKEPTDLNELLKEFANLAYHGMRATDKNFNCKIEQFFDSKIPKINIVKQDLGRVFLNMFNNSFYSINKKIALHIDNYLPTLSISTKLDGDKVLIIIRDNGLGMSEEVKQKLFNPFFTTKPTGEGTGLGLSISHDIIVKIHNGNVKVDAKEGEFASFEISLPLS